MSYYIKTCKFLNSLSSLCRTILLLKKKTLKIRIYFELGLTSTYSIKLNKSHKRPHKNTHTHTHTYTHKNTHTNKHTQIHTHTYNLSNAPLGLMSYQVFPFCLSRHMWDLMCLSSTLSGIINLKLNKVYLPLSN